MKSLRLGILVTFGAFLMTACVSSVSTRTVKKEGLSLEEKGRALLDAAWKAQGMDRLSEHEVYAIKAADKWKGMLGRMAKLWPNLEANLDLKYRVGSFDGQVTYLDGKQQGGTVGLQSWEYYTSENGEAAEFQKKGNKRRVFGLSAFQYFFEMIDRLRTAPLVTYAGEKEFKGKAYDLVFVTWGKLKRHKKHDQYLAWINKETHMMDYCEYTIHDPFLPGGSMLPGSIEFADFRVVDGISIPFMQYVYLGDPKEKQKKYLHRLTVESFTFDSFDESVLYPNANLVKVGNSKID